MLNPSQLWSVLSILVFISFTPLSAQSSSTEAGHQSTKSPPVIQCPVSAELPDRFALCATAGCWVLDGVAYCKCDIKHQESISLSFNYQQNGKAKNVCDLLLEGVNNGFTVSTYATPAQVTSDYNARKDKLGPPLAIYTCKSKPNKPIYGAQCDGGICFNSTSGKKFPGLGEISGNEIVCSCPPTTDVLEGFQITGPWHCKPGDKNENNQCCDKQYYSQMCGVTSVKTTGTRIQVSAPIGTPVMLSTILDGVKPSVNTCRF